MTISDTLAAARHEAAAPGRTALVAGIVSAFVTGNRVLPGELPALIATVGATLDSLGGPAPVEAPATEAKSPTQIRASKQDDYLVSFVDSRRYKSLKRHLSGHGLTPEAYRQRFGLPADYPMVAAAYSRRRSDLAKSFGLGRTDRAPATLAKAA